MNFQKHYELLVNRAKSRKIDGYVEVHHVVPRCMGGNDEAENLVELTAREHFIAHLLLVKIYPNNVKLIYAANMMGISNFNDGRRESKNRVYEWLKKKHAKAVSEHFKGHTHNVGRKWSKEAIEKRARSNSLVQIGKPKSEEHKTSLKKAMANPDVREKHSAPLRAVWKLQREDTGEFFTVTNLKQFCSEHALKISSLKNSFYRGAAKALFFSGFRVVEKLPPGTTKH